MPPWAARPLTIAPIACSRMPKGTLRPACTRENSPRALEHRLRRLDQVGRPADHRRRVSRRRPPSSSARPRASRSFRPPRSSAAPRASPPRSSPRQARSQSAASSGKASRQSASARATRRCAARAALAQAHVLVDAARPRRTSRRDRSPSPPWSRAPPPRRARDAVRLGRVDRVRRRSRCASGSR